LGTRAIIGAGFVPAGVAPGRIPAVMELEIERHIGLINAAADMDHARERT
jgi:hypothetical protein